MGSEVGVIGDAQALRSEAFSSRARFAVEVEEEYHGRLALAELQEFDPIGVCFG